jgi:hypothetical protein
MEEIRVDKKKIILLWVVIQLSCLAVFWPTQQVVKMIFWMAVSTLLVIYVYNRKRLLINKDGLLLLGRFISWSEIKDIKVDYVYFNFLWEKKSAKIGPGLIITLKNQGEPKKNLLFLGKIASKFRDPQRVVNTFFLSKSAKEIFKIITDNYFTPLEAGNKIIMVEENSQKRSFKGIIISGIVLLFFPVLLSIIGQLIFFNRSGAENHADLLGLASKIGWFGFLFYGALGIGILRRNEMCRIIAVIIMFAKGSAFALGLLLAMLVGYAHFGKQFVKLITQQYYIIVLAPWLLVLSVSIISLSISYYLTRPKVREQFV